MKVQLREIVPNGITYQISDRRTRSNNGVPLEVVYSSKLDQSLQKTWYDRRNRVDEIYDKSGVWRFREAINFVGIDTEDPKMCSLNLVSLDGGENSDIGPFHLYNVAKYVKLENAKTWFLLLGRNPSGSFKDGGMVSLFTQGKKLGVTRYICASTGNTAASLAATNSNEMASPSSSQYLKRPIVAIPRGKIAETKLLETLAYKAKVIQVDGNFDDALNLVRMAANVDKALYVANSITPFRLEGQKAEMLVAMEALDWEQPDWVVTPGGNLGSASAIHKAFRELKEWGWIDRLPRLAIVNAKATNTLERLYNERDLRWNGGALNRKKVTDFYSELKEELARDSRHTDMSAIDIHFPAEENLYKTLRALEEMGGVVISVTDKEAWDAKAVIDSNGLGMVDLASAATVAGMKKLVNSGIIQPSDVIVGRLTGRDKDPGKSYAYYTNPENTFANVPVQVPNEFDAFKQALYQE